MPDATPAQACACQLFVCSCAQRIGVQPQKADKDSEAYKAWYKALPQTADKDSEAYKAWYKAAPQVADKDSEAYKVWYEARQAGADEYSRRHEAAGQARMAAALEGVPLQRQIHDLNLSWKKLHRAGRQSAPTPQLESRIRELCGEAGL